MSRSKRRICQFCHEDMSRADVTTCRENNDVEFVDGRILPVIPHPLSAIYVCQDCGVDPGGHHHPGCSLDRCPGCGDYMASCPCERTCT